MKKIVSGAVIALMAALWGMSASAQDSGVISEGVFIGEKDVSGMTVDEVTAYVQSQVDALGSSTITLQMGDAQVSTTWADLGLTWENTDLVQEISELGTTGNIVRRYMEQKDLENQSSQFEIEYSLDESAEESFVNSLAAYNSDPVEGTVRMGDDGVLYVEGGTDGLTLDAGATLSTLQDYLETMAPGDTVIDAVSESVSPEITSDILSNLTDVLGTATTDYSSSTAARAMNVENGTAKISGTLLMPGESFSVTAAVAPFTAENGYGLAPSYEAGQVVDSYGGGICQVSTTLYNAVLKAELEVDQRSNHTMLVSYVDPSKDAAIAEGIMDLVFTNNQETPVFIYGGAWQGTLTFTIYGKETRPSNRTIEFVSETISQTNPDDNITLVAKTDQPVGYLYQVQTAHQGLSAVLWKNTYYDGVLTDTTQVNSSTYTASPAIYEVGVVTSNSALSSALYTAIASNDLSQVQTLIANGVADTTQSETVQSETEQSETTQTETTQTETVQTDAVQTEAVQTEATQTEAASSETSADGSGDVVVVQ